jgi:ATP-binding cassette subfamily B protein
MRNLAGKGSDRQQGAVMPLMKRVFAENARDYVGQYVLAGLCMLAIAAATAFTAWIVRDVVDELFVKQRYELILVICVSIVAAFAIRGLATYGQSVTLAKVGNNLVARYQQRLFDHLMRLGVGFYADTRSGQLAAQINQNVTGIRDLLNLTITSLLRDAVSLIGLVAVMIVQDPLLSAIALLIGPPVAFLVANVMRRMRSITRANVEINSSLLGAFQESIQGIGVVKAFTMENTLSRKIAELIAQAEARANKMARVSERVNPMAEGLAGLAIAGVIAYSGYRASTQGIPPGSVFSFITALLLAYDPLRRLTRVQVSLERALVNARMIYEILDLKPEQQDRPDAAPLKVSRGEVVFDRLSFAYGNGLPVLRDVSFTAEAGRTTAIVGGSGAGKSTLVALLQRFYDATGGAIEIDGQDISHVTMASLRGSIAYVSQQPYLFEGTIRDNIRYGRPDASDAEIEQAARLANAEDFILGQSAGYDTLVGENGVTLSGGQRQRLSIARAIVRNAPILVLDEATSALDNESEAKVQAAMDTVMQGRTTIVIAHRLSTVINAHRIVVLDQGRLVEQGTHRSLLAAKDGLYARFYRFQDHPDLQLIDDAPDEDDFRRTS